MANQCVSETAVAMFPEQFNVFRTKGREIDLEIHPDVSFSEIAPDEQAIFCRITGSVITMVYVSIEKSFEYQKKMMDILLVVPKGFLASSKPTSTKGRGYRSRKKYHNSDPFWYVNCFG